jgi:putative endopeptidase
LGLEKVERVILSHPPYQEAVGKLLTSVPVETWRNYLTLHALRPLMNKLTKEWDELRFSFYGKVLSGAKEQEPRFLRVIELCEGLLPEPTGQLYISAHFDESAKQAIYDLVHHLQEALGERIKKLEWMSQETKDNALEKLSTFVPLLGYPDKWRDYSSLELGDSFAENFVRIVEFEWQRDVGRLNLPVDRQEWLMSPATVNAYCWFNTNSVTFPAGILQPPYFDATGDFAQNYGGIGAVIGHELTHGFDDQGSLYDKLGNMISWWKEEDRKKFETLADQLIEQYNDYEINGRKVNGQLTVGENIADIGGLLVAFDAMQQRLSEKPADNQEIDGFTPQQRFCLSLARIWRENRRPESALQALVTDVHAPNEWRVNGAMTNFDPFYEAFKINPDQALYRAPEDRVRIW